MNSQSKELITQIRETKDVKEAEVPKTKVLVFYCSNTCIYKCVFQFVLVTVSSHYLQWNQIRGSVRDRHQILQSELGGSEDQFHKYLENNNNKSIFFSHEW